ncbi:carboxymuconolactone decarboxylase family protein [Cedecea davisae]|uniref:Carboxymuconolactone decarboxylase family protein n=1 Tax=Cedecea davisae TaxID=158484 RepID=A0ABS6DD86_9ENTR|nr:carboxymuconolactone decarboxylase family protein [Cedecea davisae]MBU4681148.1 carboxymuconolactone decarboxylase family protein [Cedecea davisae]MBU4685926.1 carboxymuconolactone decarboxylase family protein [Cedecea davisae]
MEQRRFSGKSHWYHETQSSLCPADVLPLVPEAAQVDDRFLLDLTPSEQQLIVEAPWLDAARAAANVLLPDSIAVTRLHTLSSYDRLSTALTVAQVYGVQRLCNHYAARLAPQPGPDSSRESNRRLTQITQFARQLASQPTLIDDVALAQLDECGLSVDDIVTFTQIIGFVGFQARAIAVLQAQQGLPVRWLPGLDGLQDADPALFGPEPASWQPGLAPVELRYARPEQLEILSISQPLRALREIAWLLAHDERALSSLSQLTRLFWQITPQVSHDSLLVIMLTSRINGSPACFSDAVAAWQGDAGLPDAMRNGERALNAWSHNHPREKAIIQAVQLLTRAPDRFSAAQLQPLYEQGFSEQEVLKLLVGAGLAGWINRLKIGLGNTAQTLAP